MDRPRYRRGLQGLIVAATDAHGNPLATRITWIPWGLEIAKNYDFAGKFVWVLSFVYIPLPSDTGIRWLTLVVVRGLRA